MNAPIARVPLAASFDLSLISTVLIVLVLTLPGVQWLSTSQSIWAVQFNQLPKGQFLYLLSKLAALYAIALFALQLSYGLAGAAARSTLGLELGVRFHRALGVGTLCLLLAHAGLFVAAGSYRTGHFAVQYALPNLFGSYYVSRIALGWWAGVGLLLAAGFALGRARLGRTWRYVHWLSVPAAVAVVVHSLTIGTESRMPIMLLAYGCMAALLFIATFLRIRLGARNKNSQT
jgi:hypothetical protein